MPAPPEKELQFTSSRFAINPGGDVVANATRSGTQLAEWLRDSLVRKGYTGAEVAADDVGWSVMCTRKPFLLWVRCELIWDIPLDPADEVGAEAIWTCFVKARKPLLTGLFAQIDPAAVDKLFKDVESILVSEPQITIVEHNWH